MRLPDRFWLKLASLFVVVLFVWSFIFPKAVLASFNPLDDYEKAVYGSDDLNLEKTVTSIHHTTILAITSDILGCVTGGPINCARRFSVSGGGGAVSAIAYILGTLYSSPPASGVQYVADITSRIGVVKPVYAQSSGGGFQGLSPILPLWRSFRNVSYFLFVIVFVVMGLAIMFRVKVSPQAVITIQSAIPKLIIALILVTFSYAIAGFLIDLMYVIGAVGIAVIGSNEGMEALLKTPALSNIIGKPENLSVLGLFLYYFGYGGQAVYNIGAGLFESLTSSAVGVVGTVVFAVSGGPIIGILVLFILAIALLLTFIRILWIVLTCYVRIVLSVIFAPLMMMLSALPGQEGAIGNWIKGLVANLSVFPLTVWMLFIAGRIASSVGGGQQLWAPPFLVTTQADGVNVKMLSGIIALGILLITPQIVNMVRDALKVPEFKYGTAMFAPIGAAGGIAGFLPKQVGQAVWQAKMKDIGTKIAGVGPALPAPNPKVAENLPRRTQSRWE